jgi:hypothetical protein
VGSPGAVFVATGHNFADALAAGAAAASVGGVIVLSDGQRRAVATESYLVGVDAAVPRFAVGGPAVQAYPQAEALRGATRIDTAVAVAERFFDATAVVGLATAWNFPDAVAGSTHVARHLGPVLLSHPDRLPDQVADWLRAHRDRIEAVYVYGGRAAVDDAVLDAVVAAAR